MEEVLVSSIGSHPWMGPQWPTEHVQMSHLQTQPWKSQTRSNSIVTFKKAYQQPPPGQQPSASSSASRGGGGCNRPQTRQNQTQFYNRQNNNCISSGSSYNSSSAAKTSASTSSKLFRPYGNNQSRPSTPSRTAFAFKPKASLLKADKRPSSLRPVPVVATNDNQVVEHLAEQQQQHICQLHNDTLVQCLEKDGVYVCKSYGPRCFIIQKVRTFIHKESQI